MSKPGTGHQQVAGRACSRPGMEISAALVLAASCLRGSGAAPHPPPPTHFLRHPQPSLMAGAPALVREQIRTIMHHSIYLQRSLLQIATHSKLNLPPNIPFPLSSSAGHALSSVFPTNVHHKVPHDRMRYLQLQHARLPVFRQPRAGALPLLYHTNACLKGQEAGNMTPGSTMFLPEPGNGPLSL